MHLILALLFGISHAIDMQTLKAQCILNPKPSSACNAQIAQYCGPHASPVARTNCQKMQAYYLMKSKATGPRAVLSALYANQKMRFAEWNSYAVDLTLVFPELRTRQPLDFVLAISEECVKKYGAGKGRWNSYQLADMNKVTLSPLVKSKRAEAEKIIRQVLPTCKNPKTGTGLLLITYLPGMPKADIWYSSEKKDSTKQMQEGMPLPPLE
jgi:hypothetical protein